MSAPDPDAGSLTVMSTPERPIAATAGGSRRPATVPAAIAPPPVAARERDRTARRRLEPGSLDAVVRLAAARHDRGELDEAARLYEEVLDVDPDHADALQLLGMLRARQGQHVLATGLLERAVRRRRRADTLQSLGEVSFARGRYARAVECFAAAARQRPDDPEPIRNLGHSWFAQDRFLEAAAAYRHLLAMLPTDANGWSALGFALIHLKMHEEAARAFGLALRFDPDDAESRHMHAALSGQRTSRAPDAYVRGLFDHYADRYDRHLEARLAYRVPTMFREMLRDSGLEADGTLRVADLGCGTGLCGEAVADMAASMVGIDLSPRMLERSRRRPCYTELVERAVEPWLAETPDRFDLILAGDVLIYIGELRPVFSGVLRVLEPGGLFAFSTETTTQPGYELRPSGRYAHCLSTVDELLAEAGLEVVSRRPAIIRVEKDKPLDGHLTLVRRPR
jgi:predicted TPR repeat methyltransferase